MSDKKTSTNVESPEAKADGKKEVVSQSVNTPESLSFEDALKRLAALESTNARLLDENKKVKSNWQQVKEAKDSEDKARLEEQGKFKELYTKLEQDHTELKKSMVRGRVEQAVLKEAGKYGAQDLEAVFALGNSGLLQYDESSGDVLGVEMFLEDLKKRKAYLFGSPKASINQVTPGVQPHTEKKFDLKSISKMSAKDKNAVWAQALNKK